MNFKTLFVLLLTLCSVQAKAWFTVTECHNCQDEQLSQRAVSQGEGYHFIMNFGDNPGIHYFHVQNILLGGDPVERQSADRNLVYTLGAIPMPVPAEAEAQFRMIKEAIDQSKSVTRMDIPAGTDLDPSFGGPYANTGLGYRLNNVMELAPPSARANFLGRLGTHLDNLPVISRYGVALIRARGQAAAFSVGGTWKVVDFSLGASYQSYDHLLVMVWDQFGGRVDVRFNPGSPNGTIENVWSGDGQLVNLDTIHDLVVGRQDITIPAGHESGAASAYAETLRRNYHLPSGFRPINFGPGGNVVCGTTEVDGVVRYTCMPRG